MPQVNVIRWREGAGWLVLVGGGDLDSPARLDIEAQALAKNRLGEPVAYIWAAGDVENADDHLSRLDDMGAPTGYLVDIVSEDDDSIRSQMREAGLILLGDGPNVETLRSALMGAAAGAISAAYARGAVILGIGAGASVLGEILDDGKPGSYGKKGLGWLENAIIMPRYSEKRAGRLRELVEHHLNSYGLGIQDGAALALGPGGRVEALGNRLITVSLGRHTEE